MAARPADNRCPPARTRCGRAPGDRRREIDDAAPHPGLALVDLHTPLARRQDRAEGPRSSTCTRRSGRARVVQHDHRAAGQGAVGADELTRPRWFVGAEGAAPSWRSPGSPNRVASPCSPTSEVAPKSASRSRRAAAKRIVTTPPLPLRPRGRDAARRFHRADAAAAADRRGARVDQRQRLTGERLGRLRRAEGGALL